MLESKMLINGCCHLPDRAYGGGPLAPLPHADGQTGGATVMRLGRCATVHCPVSFISARLRWRGARQARVVPPPPPIEIDLTFLSRFVNPGTAALVREGRAARPPDPSLAGGSDVLDSADSIL